MNIVNKGKPLPGRGYIGRGLDGFGLRRTHKEKEMARQLKGGTKKETATMRRERKKANVEAKSQLTTVVLPIVLLVVLVIIVFVYFATAKRN